MSIIVSVKIHDGIVMAADSATTFYKTDGQPSQIYENANKVVNLVKGIPVGVMTCGAGGIGNASIVTLLKDLRYRLGGTEDGYNDWELQRTAYTMEKVTGRVHEFFALKAAEADFEGFLMLRICGYSSGRPLPEVWQVAIANGKILDPLCVQSEDNMGPLWNGENEALDRLMIGVPGTFGEKAVTAGLATDQIDKLRMGFYEPLILPAAPIQDAIDLAKYMVETTKGFIRFSITRVKTVGGPVEIAAITKHEGFKWVHRKHFYSEEFNRPAN